VGGSCYKMGEKIESSAAVTYNSKMDLTLKNVILTTNPFD
jgi:hypothetical protein